MKNNELQTYLARFEPDRVVAVIVIDPEKRLYYKVSGYQLLDDADVRPVLIFETTETGPLDDVLEEATDER